MRKTIALLSLGLGIALGTPILSVAEEAPLQRVEVQDSLLGLDSQLWGCMGNPGDKQALIQAIDHSLRYLNTPSAAQAYRNYPVEGISRDRVRRSLVRFRQLLLTSPTPEALQAAVKREFAFYKSVGRSTDGEVLFTAYFEPVYEASRIPTAEYRYPLYAKPTNFDQWKSPHPTRVELEGTNGLLGARSPLAGYELVWLRDRFEAFLIHVQGSARLQLPDGSIMSVGYAGKTEHSYSSIGRELVKDEKLPLDGLTLPVLIDYFRNTPEELDVYFPRNESFVFFRETNGAPATGSLGVPVTADRSIATDKSIMPPGALALVSTEIPYPNTMGELEMSLVSRYMLDQDTGSAIKGPGRVDLFLGTGQLAGDRAGIVATTGDLYYLLLKE
ncbi:MAG: murein transglycosylase A [Chroococcales cyanobacterium]